jgi:hypothetical protein
MENEGAEDVRLGRSIVCPWWRRLATKRNRLTGVTLERRSNRKRMCESWHIVRYEEREANNEAKKKTEQHT